MDPRFPDLSEPYDRDLQHRALAAAAERGIPIRRGVYAAVIGPGSRPDQGLRDALKPVDVPEILRIAVEAEPRLTEVFEAVLSAG